MQLLDFTMPHSSASQLLSQFLLLSLLIERMVAVGTRLATRKVDALLSDGHDDTLNTWSKPQIVTAIVLGLVICFTYDFDLFSALLVKVSAPEKVLPDKATERSLVFLLGATMTSLVLGGGSSGIQKVTSAIDSGVKAYRADAQVRLAAARSALRRG